MLHVVLCASRLIYHILLFVASLLVVMCLNACLSVLSHTLQYCMYLAGLFSVLFRSLLITLRPYSNDVYAGVELLEQEHVAMFKQQD